VTVVAIDGPAGAGKSTVARAVAERIRFDFLDTGAMYRAVALVALREGVDPADATAMGRIAADIDLTLDRDVVLVGGEDVSTDIRGAGVTAAVSLVSRHPQVRAQMVERQRQIAAGKDVVVEGRDIGSVVFPEAEVKIYLTASIDERARRRTDQLDLDGGSLADIRAEIETRDRADSTRAESPLSRPHDAVEVDTTGRSVDEVVDEIERLVSGP
jgi:cytidylate kinase